MSNNNAEVILLLQQAVKIVETFEPISLRVITRMKLTGIIKQLQTPQPSPLSPPKPASTQSAPTSPAPIRSVNTIDEYHAMWNDLHAALDADAKWDESFDNRLICQPCSGHWVKIKKDNPPVYGSGRYEWTVKVHNLINAKIGKPNFIPASKS